MLKLPKTYLFVLAASSVLTACNASPSKDTKAEQTKDHQITATADTGDLDIKKISEALGHFIGRNLKAPGISFDTDSIIKGIREGAEGKKSPMSDEEYEKAMAQLQQKAVNTLADTNIEAAEKFMKDNATAQGVVEIVPGKLQYLILEKGHDPVVPEHGTPQINYTGKYIDGTVFGTSDNAGGPIAVPIDQTIPGFSKGIAGMKEGEKRRLFVHPEFGYGRAGQLPPNSLLIFDIEVVKAQAPAKEATLGDDRDLDDELDTDQEFDQKAAPTAKVAPKDATVAPKDAKVAPKDAKAAPQPASKK